MGSNTRGFTLIEVMVVVFIVTVITGLTVIGFSNALSQNSQSIARKLQAWFEHVEQSADLSNANIGVFVESKRVQAKVYYRKRWHTLNSVPDFMMPDQYLLRYVPGDNQIDTPIEPIEASADLHTNRANITYIPNFSWFPQGYIEVLSPQGDAIRVNY